MLKMATIILAGGKSERMGEDKRGLKISNESILTELIKLFLPISKEVILSVDDGAMFTDLGVKIAQDEIAYLGPLSGILTGLKATSEQYNLVVSCDMPFVRLNLVKAMMDRAPGNDVVICKLGYGFEPLLAIYSTACIPLIEASLKRGKREVISFLGEAKVAVIAQSEVAKIDPDLISFFNLNTPADFERAKEIKRRAAEASSSGT